MIFVIKSQYLLTYFPEKTLSLSYHVHDRKTCIGKIPAAIVRNIVRIILYPHNL